MMSLSWRFKLPALADASPLPCRTSSLQPDQSRRFLVSVLNIEPFSNQYFLPASIVTISIRGCKRLKTDLGRIGNHLLLWIGLGKCLICRTVWRQKSWLSKVLFLCNHARVRGQDSYLSTYILFTILMRGTRLSGQTN